MSKRAERLRWTVSGLLCTLTAAAAATAADRPQWGQQGTRNMVAQEQNLAESFDPATGRNIKWVVSLGTETHGTPTIANGRVLIGTNNGALRDPRHTGDRGVLMCFDEKDGRFLWQLVVPKLRVDHQDWPNAGIVAPPTIEGNRVYTLSNRHEVMCLDLLGQANGNDGPYQDEGRHMAMPDGKPMEVTPLDADIIWLFDLPNGAGIYPHDVANCSILVDGPLLYVNTSNGVDASGRIFKVGAADAPALVVIEKATGRLVARDHENMSPRTPHATWASPALGEVHGRRRIFFGGPDGICYAFEPLREIPPPGEVAKLRCVWRFDCDPTAPKENIHRYVLKPDGPSNINGMPVFYKNRIYVAAGGDFCWGKKKAWLKCIDATGAGDITKTGELWSYPLKQHCVATPAISSGLVFITDCGRTLHCVDAETGKPYWTHDGKGEFYASPLVADGKVYAVSRAGDFWILAAGKEKKVFGSVTLDGPISSTPVAANGVLYVTTRTRLYAVQKSR